MDSRKKNNSSLFAKLTILFLLVASLSVAPIHARPVKAFWGEFVQARYQELLRKLGDQVLGMIMGNLKQVALQSLTSEMNGIIGGTSSQNSKIIGNYRDFLDVEPTQKTNIYINDYISQITRGRGSESSYIPYNEGFGDGAFTSGIGGNYVAQISQAALAGTARTNTPQLSYVGDPRQNLFSEGNLNNFNLYLSGINNPWALNLDVEQKYQERLTAERNAALAEAIAGGGVKSTRQGDTIITPGSITQGVAINTLDLGNKILADAKSVPEVITSVVQQIISQSIQNGIGSAQSNAQRETAWKDPDKQTWVNPDGPAAAWKNPDLAN